MSNLEGDEVFEASSLGSCEEVAQERVSDDELIIIRGPKVGFVLAQIVQNEGSPIETFDTGFYVIDPSDQDNEV